MVIVLLCMNGAVNIVVYCWDNEHENEFLWSGALAVKTIRNRLAKLFPLPRTVSVHGYHSQVLNIYLFMFQFMSSSLRPIMKLYNYIFYLFFLSIQYYDSFHHLPSASLYSPWCRRSPCFIGAFFCACIRNKAECYWMMAPFISRCRSQWLQFDTFEAQRNEPLDSRRVVFCSCWQGFCFVE